MSNSLFFIYLTVFIDLQIFMKKPIECKNISEIRQQIDRIDAEIIQLLGERFGYIKEIVKYKPDKESIVAKERYETVISQRRKWAEEYGFSPDLAEELFKTLVDYNIQKELELFEKMKNNHQ